MAPENDDLKTAAEQALEEAEKPSPAPTNDANNQGDTETPEIHTVELPVDDPNSDSKKAATTRRRKRIPKIEKEIEHEEPTGRKEYKHRKRTSPIPRKRKGSWLSDFFDF